MGHDTLDLKGLKCPLPALLAKRRLARATPGACLLVITDDPMAPVDVPFMCGTEGFEVLTIARHGDEARMLLKRP